MEEDAKNEDNIQELIPLLYRYLNIDFGEKYITLNEKNKI